MQCVQPKNLTTETQRHKDTESFKKTMACIFFHAHPESDQALQDKSLFFLGVSVPLWFN